MTTLEPQHTTRPAYDAYTTPPSAISALLDAHSLPGDGWICEPCAGDGAIVQQVRERYPDRSIRAIEIRPECAEPLRALTSQVVIADFVSWAQQYRRDFPEREIAPSVIITNPPFSVAREILDAAFLVAGPQTQIIMLLRLAFLESRGRKAWWQEHLGFHLYVLSERPKFARNKYGHLSSDATAYGWFAWGAGVEKGVSVL